MLGKTIEERSKKSFLDLGENRQGFGIQNPSEAPKGLATWMLWNLWDIGTKFSQTTYKGLGFKAFPLLLELFDFRRNDTGGLPGMFIGKIRESGFTDEGTLLFSLNNGIDVIWDKGFSTTNIHQVIEEVDKEARSKGLIEKNHRILLIDHRPMLEVAMTETGLWRS